MHRLKIIFLCALISIVTACKEPEPGFVFIANNTAQPIKVIANFQAKGNTSKPLTMELKPGQRDGWRYLLGKSERAKLDETFQSLSIQNNECEVVLNRQQIEELAKNAGAWELEIDSAVISCGEF